MGLGEWQDCECPICKGNAERSELEAGLPPLYKYFCMSCREFAIDLNTTNQKEDVIEEQGEVVSGFISGYSARHDKTLIIVTANPIGENEITIEQILESATRQSPDETIDQLSDELNGL